MTSNFVLCTISTKGGGKVNEIFLWSLAIFNIFGSILNVKKMSVSFLIWTIGNVVWIYVDAKMGSFPRVALDVINLWTSTWGLITWFREEQEKYKKPFKYEKLEENKKSA